jgi:hypothetical protein
MILFTVNVSVSFMSSDNCIEGPTDTNQPQTPKTLFEKIFTTRKSREQKRLLDEFKYATTWTERAGGTKLSASNVQALYRHFKDKGLKETKEVSRIKQGFDFLAPEFETIAK